MTRGADWSGRVGESWAVEWQGTERTFAALEPALERAILAALPKHGRFLDIGCGVGTTTLALAAARPAAEVHGADLSVGMIEIARQRAAGLNAQAPTFEVADALAYAEAIPPIDSYVSRHGVMFFDDAALAFRRLREAASPRAPLVFSCFRSVTDNPWASELIAEVTGDRPAPATGYAPGPFAFAEPDFVTDLLTRAGWTATRPEPIDYPYLAGEGDDAVAQATALLTRIGPVARAIADAPERDRPALRERLGAALARRVDAGRVAFPAAAWIWTAHAA